MRTDKDTALQMRKAGDSYNEISRKLGISKSTLSVWFSKTGWSQRIRRRLNARALALNTERIIHLGKIRGKNLADHYKVAREEARKQFASLYKDPLFLSGVALYWGEGDKQTRHLVRLVNCDPLMIRLYVAFLLHACKIPRKKIKLALHIYPDLDDKKCLAFWARTSRMPQANFTRSVLLKGTGVRKSPHGMCTVVISSTYFKVKMLEWLRLLPQQLL